MKDFEIEDFCTEYISKEYQPDFEASQKIKKCAYEQGVKFDQINAVLIVELRDKLLRI